VTRRSNSHIFALVLCVFALFVAQTFGSKAGYYCLCGGKPVQTQSSYCDGPHGAKCHADDAKDAGSHSEKDSGSRKEHQVVNQEVQLRSVEAGLQVIAPQVLLAILPLLEVLARGHDAMVAASYSVDFGESPPFGVTVARTIVLRI
jgi:hypothetical protein